MTTSYGSPGATMGLSSSVHGTLVDEVSYDGAHRLTAFNGQSYG